MPMASHEIRLLIATRRTMLVVDPRAGGVSDRVELQARPACLAADPWSVTRSPPPPSGRSRRGPRPITMVAAFDPRPASLAALALVRVSGPGGAHSGQLAATSAAMSSQVLDAEPLSS
jgi:hypothetical protein